VPADQDYRLRVPRHPQEEMGEGRDPPRAHRALDQWCAPVYNAKDGHSWEDEHVWNQNAVVVESESFDSCLGHPAGASSITTTRILCVCMISTRAPHSPASGLCL